MRLIAVMLLSLITFYWAGYSLYLLFLPDGAAGATTAVVIGGVCLLVAAIYAFTTWGTLKVKRGLHLAAVVVVGLWLGAVAAASVMSIAGLLAVPLSVVPWDVWLLTAVNLAALVLLVRTIPSRTKK
jgi:hypothetical protein